MYVLTLSGPYDSVLITSSLAFPHIDLERKHAHMAISVVIRQLFLSLIETLDHRSRFAVKVPFYLHNFQLTTCIT